LPEVGLGRGGIVSLERSLGLNRAHQAFTTLCWWGLPAEIRSLRGTPYYGPRQIMIQKFEMSMMGELKYFLGFQIKQLQEDTFIIQTKYIQDILKKFGMKNAKPIKTPMGTNGHLDLDIGGKSHPFLDSCRKSFNWIKSK
jgi:hypothetical protein